MAKVSQASENISIHAPSRERLSFGMVFIMRLLFQSTLPHGSDLAVKAYLFR